MYCILPLAGFQTRFSGADEMLPKSLHKVRGIILLDNIINRCLEAGIEKFILVTNDKFYPAYLNWSENKKIDLKIINNKIKDNEHRLGILGDICLGLKEINKDFVVVHADWFFDFSLNEYIKKFGDGYTDLVLLRDVKDKEKAKRFGIYLTDENEFITNIEEKPDNPESTLTDAGIFFMKADAKQIAEQIASEGDNKGKGIPHVLMQRLKNKKSKAIKISDSAFCEEIGTKEAYSAILETLEK